MTCGGCCLRLFLLFILSDAKNLRIYTCLCLFLPPLHTRYCHPERSCSPHTVSNAVEGPAVVLAVACFCCHPERSEGSRRTQRPKTIPTFQPIPLYPVAFPCS